ncbi:MAG: NAD-dependent epimerase/dehydratase family protein [Pseudomonadales bacterium]
MWKGSSVLVTGGAGFVGSNLVDGLVAAGAKVRVLDDMSGGSEENLVKAKDHIELHVADLRDADAVNKAVAGCDTIFHMGANASVPKSVENRENDFSSNVVGTYNVADAAIKHNVERILYASTAAAYGTPQYTPVDEGHALDPVSPYGATKLCSERLLFGYSQVFDFDLAVVRIFNTYGPRQRHYVAYDLMMKLAKDPTKLEVLGSGNQERDYCYIDDMVAGLMFVAERASTPGEVFNISGGRTVSIRELVALILDTLRLSETEVTYGAPSWKGDIDILSGDVTKITEAGWKPTVSIEDGLRTMAQELGLI